MLRSLYNRIMSLAASRYATWTLAAVSFAESSFFPIPPDVLLIPMVLARRASAWLYAAICTAASILGGLFGWLIGAFLFTSIALPILEFYGYADQFDSFAQRYNDQGAWIVFFAGLTPFPYKVITIASGATGLSLPVFLAASVLSRGLRFFAVAGLLWWLGPPIRDFIERWLGLLFTIFVILLIGGFVGVRYLL
ncbi:YqaA family protein [Microbaculum marinum]|uniref:YqaA family protein n=1 Tax=Microbaculum marinum TaxID=1764581 RepID=A0AAW9RQ85_9HYPH